MAFKGIDPSALQPFKSEPTKIVKKIENWIFLEGGGIILLGY